MGLSSSTLCSSAHDSSATALEEHSPRRTWAQQCWNTLGTGEGGGATRAQGAMEPAGLEWERPSTQCPCTPATPVATSISHSPYPPALPHCFCESATPPASTHTPHLPTMYFLRSSTTFTGSRQYGEFSVSWVESAVVVGEASMIAPVCLSSTNSKSL